MSKEKDKWEEIERIAKKEKKKKEIKKYEESQSIVKSGTGPIKEYQPHEMGFLAKRELKKAGEKLTLESWKAAYREKLEVWTQAIKHEADLAKKEVFLSYKNRLMELNKEHLKQLDELELDHVVERGEAFRKLGVKVSKLLEACTQDDIPQFMKEKNIDAITNMYYDLFDKIHKKDIDSDISHD